MFQPLGSTPLSLGSEPPSGVVTLVPLAEQPIRKREMIALRNTVGLRHDQVVEHALDAVPVDVLEAIEVAKAITPDMDAEAIGGSVNLVTRKAPEVRTMSLEAAGGFAPIRDRFAGSGSATFGDRTGDKRFGYLLGGSYSRRHFGADDLEPEYDIGSLGPSDDVLAGLEVRHYSVWRARIGGTAALDYRLSPSSNLFLSSLYSELQDEEQRRRVIHGLEDDELEEEFSFDDDELSLDDDEPSFDDDDDPPSDAEALLRLSVR